MTKQGHTDQGHTKQGLTKQGHTKQGHTELGHTELGHTDLGQTEMGLRTRRFRFGLATVLVVMLVMAVLAAGAGYLVRAARSTEQQAFSMQLQFFLFTLASPVLLMILLSLGRRFILWLNRPDR